MTKMKGNPERMILVPLGDKACEDLGQAAFREAKKLADGVLDQEELAERHPIVSISSLQPQDRGRNLIHSFKARGGITAIGGYLITIKQAEAFRKT